MTIHQLKSPCFVLDPSPWDDDAGVPHYPTRHKARKELAEVRAEEDGDAERLAELARVRARRLPAPCWIAECDGPGCKDTLGNEDEGPSCVHFDTAGEVIGWMPGESWTRAGADGALCWTHSPQDAAPLPPSPAELEAAGQMRLPGVA